MALENTSDRYNYIFGNTARELEVPERAHARTAGTGTVRQAKPERTIVLRSSAAEGRRARVRRQQERAERAHDFDWKYTVVITAAAFILMVCAIFYVQGTVRIHNLTTQITELKSEKAGLVSKQTALKTEIDKSINLNEIRSYAVKKKGMVYPGQKHTIYYKDDNRDYFRQYESINIGKQ